MEKEMGDVFVAWDMSDWETRKHIPQSIRLSCIHNQTEHRLLSTGRVSFAFIASCHIYRLPTPESSVSFEMTSQTYQIAMSKYAYKVVIPQQMI
jgi:hypothetical protein